MLNAHPRNHKILKTMLSQKEKNKIIELCINNPQKSCAIVQTFIDSLQLMPCSTFAELKGKSKRTILYQSDKLTGISIDNRKFLTLIQ
jgi:hypothetical protein